MKKKGALLLISFIAFYTLVHSIRHLPDLLHGQLDWNGEKTYTLSIIRIVADMLISYLFTLLPYLLFFGFYPQRKFRLIIIGIIISLSVCFLIGFWWTNFMEDVPVRLSNYLSQAVFFYTIDTIFGITFYFIRYSHYKELQETEAMLVTKQAELSFLRSQINPHFLFNNLNNIYSLVYYQSDQSLNAIAGLSELLRYMLYDTGDSVTLTKEVNYIEKYIALQQLRFEKPSEVDMKTNGNLESIAIPPLLFIPFVENAFKHGNVSASQWLNIGLEADKHYVHFTCSNKKTMQHKDPQGGIGIDNVKRRLALLYPEKHELEIIEDDVLFTVNLKIYNGK